MEPKRSKYDTNPLDDKFADRATDAFESEETEVQTKRVLGGRTVEMDPSRADSVQGYSESEAPTRHINDKVTSYPSVFIPPHAKPAPTYEAPRMAAANIYQPPPVPPPGVYQPPSLQAFNQSGRNTVAGIGIPERWAVMLPYLPFWLGIVACVVELLVVPRRETRVRFHAAQGLMLQLVVTAISMLLGVLGDFSGRMTGATPFKIATLVFFIVAMVRVFKGKPLVIAPLDEPRKWLDEKIKPRN
jgi:uncharacterized membrane protein